jgi:hypothetical protein
MLFRVVILFCLTGCVAEAPSRPTVAVSQTYHAKRTLRVIGTERDMTQGGEQYCRGGYKLEYTSWDKTEGLITCE